MQEKGKVGGKKKKGKGKGRGRKSREGGRVGRRKQKEEKGE